MRTERPIEEALDRLRGIVQEMGSVLVAFSGGIDSSLVLKVAHDVLGPQAVAATAVSPAVAASEVESAQRVASWIGAQHHLVSSRVLDEPAYIQNGPSRCYTCKIDLYGCLHSLAQELGLHLLANGVHMEDLGDFRPGLQAAREFGVRSPLLEANVGKEGIRKMSRSLDLPNWDKAADACLSSRVPHGTLISEDLLHRIERAEALLKEEGFKQVRVRYHHNVARIELAQEEMGMALDQNFRSRIASAFRKMGFDFVTLDLEGYRQGSLNRNSL